jgi:signal transduction histidine kinase
VIDLARDAVAVVEPFARGKDLPLEIASGIDPATRIESDPGKIHQILVNLLSNAVKFTERGHVTVRIRADDVHVWLDIVDTGVGISPGQVARIFDPFWQVERPNIRRAGGTGLGLSVSQRYARLLGGDVRVTSELGAGSTFTVCLPLHYDAAHAERAREAGVADATAQLRFAAARGRAAAGEASDQ